MLSCFSDANLADPYPGYAALREQGPLIPSQAFFGGAWLVTRFHDVESALKDHRLSARRTGGWLNRSAPQARRELSPLQQLFSRALLFQDAPSHHRLRRALAPGFKSSAWTDLPQRIQNFVFKQLSLAVPGGSFDFIETLARPLPARVVAHLMGLENAPIEKFGSWSADMAAFLGHPDPDFSLAQAAQSATLQMAEMFQQELRLRRRNRSWTQASDWLSLLLQAKDQGHIESLEELLAQCVMLLFAGHETTRHLLGNGLYLLASVPTVWQKLRAEPALLPLAIREMLRFESPVQYTGRRVAEAFEWHGHRLERGDLVIPLIGSAHRDSAAFSEPDEFQWNRRGVHHLAFGSGPHTCIGALLTMIEAQSVFSALLHHWPQAPHCVGAPAQMPSMLYRGFDHFVLKT